MPGRMRCLHSGKPSLAAVPPCHCGAARCTLLPACSHSNVKSNSTRPTIRVARLTEAPDGNRAANGHSRTRWAPVLFRLVKRCFPHSQHHQPPLQRPSTPARSASTSTSVSDRAHLGQPPAAFHPLPRTMVAFALASNHAVVAAHGPANVLQRPAPHGPKVLPTSHAPGANNILLAPAAMSAATSATSMPVLPPAAPAAEAPAVAAPEQNPRQRVFDMLAGWDKYE